VTLVLLASSFLALPYLRGDGNGYYAWLRSSVIDEDLQFADEFRQGDPAFVPSVFDAQGNVLPELQTSTGYVRNQWSPGPAILWAPFFLCAHGVVVVSRSAGVVDWEQDGFSLPYLWATAIANALFASVGLLLSYRVATNVAGKGPAVAGTVAVWLASSLPVYQYLLPFGAYGTATLVAAGLMTVWYPRDWSIRKWLLLGLLAGFITTVHPVASVWVLLPVTSLLGLDPGTLRERITAGGWFAVAGTLGALPGMVAKSVVNGSPFATTYRPLWQAPDFVSVLVGAQHGLFSWTPIAAIAILGMVLLWRRERRFGIGLSIVFLAMLTIVAMDALPELSSYGNRFFVLFTPGFVVGAAVSADAVWAHRRLVIVGIAVLALWNALFAFQWAWGLVPKREAVDWPTMARQQFTTAPRELGEAIRLFFTDRGELIRRVQERDLGALQSGQDVGE
jgi:hypothetical protein